MTNALATPKTTRLLLLIAACLVALAYVQWGAVRGTATLVGAGLSLLNWLALRWLTARILEPDTDAGESARLVDAGEPARGSARSKAFISLLLVGKIGVLIGVVYVLIQHLRVDPVGLAFGLGVLFIGPLVAGVVSGGRALHPPSAAAAREER
jgi:hypothetical protein